MYNPSDVGKRGTLFGLPYSQQESDLIILPVNLDVTTSYGDGTAQAPQLVLYESSQLDLSLPFIKDSWKLKMVMNPKLISEEENETFREKANVVIDALENGKDPNESYLDEVNSFCERVHSNVEGVCDELLDQGKTVGVLGGDHSSPFGLLKSLAKREQFGILQIDAHMDLRNSYEGFTYSHASIMHNAMNLEGVSSLTQVGIRDFCEEEEEYIRNSNKEIHTFYDELSFTEKMNGETWADQTKKIIQTLPESVYVSFDIDGLDTALCPTTGTPVPGGLRYNEAVYLLNELAKSGRKIIGFDLSEVGSTTWDANVGSRILYRLAASMGVSQGLLSLK